MGRAWFAGRGSSAVGVASGGQGTGQEEEDLISCSSTQPEADHFPFLLQLLPPENISSSY